VVHQALADAGKRRTYIEPPTAYDVRKAVEALLTPASVYRVRWSSVKPAKREGSFDWEQLDKADPAKP
jgi:hypothetical protein